jgi:6,7-dimethyl-8-ribityllumazine synthase
LPKRIGLVFATFHHAEMAIMREEAESVAKDLGLEIATVVSVPGAMELPLSAKLVLSRHEIDGLAVLGIIERGETGHGFVMGHAVIGSLISLQLELMKPIGVGILGPEIFPSQIPSRLHPHARAAVEAVHHMLMVG